MCVKRESTTFEYSVFLSQASSSVGVVSLREEGVKKRLKDLSNPDVNCKNRDRAAFCDWGG